MRANAVRPAGSRPVGAFPHCAARCWRSCPASRGAHGLGRCLWTGVATLLAIPLIRRGLGLPAAGTPLPISPADPVTRCAALCLPFSFALVSRPPPAWPRPRRARHRPLVTTLAHPVFPSWRSASARRPTTEPASRPQPAPRRDSRAPRLRRPGPPSSWPPALQRSSSRRTSPLIVCVSLSGDRLLAEPPPFRWYGWAASFRLRP